MSKVFNDIRRRWLVHKYKAFVIVAALAKFDCYLRGKSFKIYADNSNLQCIAKSTTAKMLQ